jgi:hypothetical protein
VSRDVQTRARLLAAGERGQDRRRVVLLVLRILGRHLHDQRYRDLAAELLMSDLIDRFIAMLEECGIKRVCFCMVCKHQANVPCAECWCKNEHNLKEPDASTKVLP